MPIAPSHHSGLSDADRRMLEQWLAEFDSTWSKDRLAKRVRELPRSGHPLRLPALMELVKIDLARQWQQGREARLEAYLKALPELGKPETVTVDLILAEFAACGPTKGAAELEEICRRFPRQAAEVRQRLEQTTPPASGSAPTSTLSAQHPEPRTGWDEPPELFGRYRILKKIGKGGMGAVYLAQDTQLDRQVALKIPRFNPEDGPSVLERFYREARSAATINHPNICPVFDVGQEQGIHYLTMAFVEGRALSAFIKTGKSLPANQVANVVRKIALGLQEAHKRGVIHRDLKPSNVMINQRSEPIIMDFGLARRADDDARLTKDGSILGTPAYMPPEQVNGNVEAMGPACDIYSLGVILYELLALRLPFDGPIMAMLARILTEQPEPPSKIRTDVDPHLESICLRAMAKKIEDRYASMTAFAGALADYLRGGKPSPTPVSVAATISPADSPLSQPQPASVPEPILPAPESVPTSPFAALTQAVSLPAMPVGTSQAGAVKPSWIIGIVVASLALLGGTAGFLILDPWGWRTPRLASTEPGASSGPVDEKVASLIKSLREEPDTQSKASAAKLAVLGAPAVMPLRSLLKDTEPRTRQRAAAALGDIGPAAAPAVVALAGMLHDTDDSVRVAAVRALGLIGDPARQALPNLIQAMADPSGQVSEAAAVALSGKLAPNQDDVAVLAQGLTDEQAPIRRFAAKSLAKLSLDPKESQRLFTACLKDTDREVRLQAARALARTVPETRDEVFLCLLAALRDSDVDMRREVQASLRQIGGPSAGQVPALLALLKDQVAEVRRFAAATLGGLGREAKHALPDLLQALRDSDLGVARAAAEAITKVLTDPRAVVPALSEAMKSPLPPTRQLAASVLAKLATDARAEVYPVLLQGLADEDRDVRQACLDGLSKTGTPSRDDLPQLAGLLASQSPAARGFAVVNLAQLGSDQRETVMPLLLQALADGDMGVRKSATEALARVGDPLKSDLPLLLQSLGNRAPPVRAYAAAAIGKLGSEARGAVVPLGELLKDTNLDVTLAAVEALGSIGTDAIPALPRLIDALDASNKDLRRAAAAALGRIGPEAAEASVPALVAALRGPDKQVGAAAIVALGQMGPAARAAIAPLIGTFAGDADTQQKAIVALSKIGKEAVPALTNVLKQSGSADRRLAAARTLGEIGPDARGAAVIQLAINFKKDPDKRVREAAGNALKSIQR